MKITVDVHEIIHRPGKFALFDQRSAPLVHRVETVGGGGQQPVRPRTADQPAAAVSVASPAVAALVKREAGRSVDRDRLEAHGFAAVDQQHAAFMAHSQHDTVAGTGHPQLVAPVAGDRFRYRNQQIARRVERECFPRNNEVEIVDLMLARRIEKHQPEVILIPLSVKTADKVLLQPDHQPNISDVKQSSLQKRQLLHVEGEAGKPDVAAVAEMYARRDFGGKPEGRALRFQRDVPQVFQQYSLPARKTVVAGRNADRAGAVPPGAPDPFQHFAPGGGPALFFVFIPRGNLRRKQL